MDPATTANGVHKSLQPNHPGSSALSLMPVGNSARAKSKHRTLGRHDLRRLSLTLGFSPVDGGSGAGGRFNPDFALEICTKSRTPKLAQSRALPVLDSKCVALGLHKTFSALCSIPSLMQNPGFNGLPRLCQSRVLRFSSLVSKGLKRL